MGMTLSEWRSKTRYIPYKKSPMGNPKTIIQMAGLLTAFLSSSLLAADGDDPYLWLEANRGDRVFKWIDQQNN
jgi:hypothetical protein